VAQQDNVVAVPIDAVRTVRELPAMAAALGLNSDDVRAQLQQQMETRTRVAGAGGANGGSAGGRDSTLAGAGRHHNWDGASNGSVAVGAGGGTPGSSSAGTASAGHAAAAGTSGRRDPSRAQAVLVKTDRGLEPRLVRIGISNFDYAQVLSGVNEGEQVALLSLAEVQSQRDQDQSRLRQRLGTGVPGSGGSAGSGGGAGARRPGGS